MINHFKDFSMLREGGRDRSDGQTDGSLQRLFHAKTNGQRDR